MTRIESGRYSTILRRLLSQASEIHVADELSPELSATVVLEADRPEWRFLAGERMCSDVRRQILSAIAISTVRFQNPANSGILVVFESLMVQVETADTVLCSLIGAEAELAGGRAGVALDTRYGVARNSACRNSADNVAAAGTAFNWHRALLLANSPYVIPGRMPVLAPGTGLEFSTSAVNISLSAGGTWLERAIGRYERAS